jgi:hypothetical protein
MAQAFSALASGGTAELAKVLRLGSIAGLSPLDVWDRLADFVCSEGGSVDEAIVRAAFCQTLKQEMEDGLADLREANVEQLAGFFERFIVQCVIERISQDGGSLLEQNGVSSAAAFAHVGTFRSLVSVFVRQKLSTRSSRGIEANYNSREINALVRETLQDTIAAVSEWGENG